MNDFELYFVRPGECEANVRRVYAGKTDTTLTDMGKEQVISEGRRLKLLGHSFDAIVSSPLGRALETAKLIAESIGYPIGQIELEAGVTERSGGMAEGMRREDFLALDATHQNALGAESLESLRARAEAVYELLQERYQGKKVLLVSHAAFGEMLRIVIEKGDYRTAFDHEPLPNAITVRLV